MMSRKQMYRLLLIPLIWMVVAAAGCSETPDLVFSNPHDPAWSEYLPAAPSRVAIRTIADTLFRVSWHDDSEGETGFRVERKTTAEGYFRTVAVVPRNTSLFDDREAKAADTEYWYRVAAIAPNGVESASGPVSARFRVLAPEELTCSGTGETSVRISWKPDTTVGSRIRIQRKVKFGVYSDVKIVDGKDTVFVDGAVDRRTMYYYRLQRATSSFASPWSEEMPVAFGVTAATSLRTMQTPYLLEDMRLSDDDAVIGVLNSNGSAGVYRVMDGSLLCSVPIPSRVVMGFALSGDASVLGVGWNKDSSAFSFFRVSTGALIRTVRVRGTTRALEITDDGKRAILSCDSSAIEVWDIERGILERSLPGFPGKGPSLFLHPDNVTLITGADNTVRFWDISSGQELRRVAGGEFLKHPCIDENGDILGAVVYGWGGYDGTFRIYNFSQDVIRDVLVIPGSGTMNATAIHPSYRVMLVAGLSETYAMSSLSGVICAVLKSDPRGDNAVTLMREGNTVLIGGQSGEIRSWRLNFGWRRM